MKKILAVDIGGTHIKSAVVTLAAEINGHRVLDTPRDLDKKGFENFFAETVGGRLTEEIAGIGISTLGTVEAKSGAITGVCSNLPSLRGIEMKKKLEQKFGLPVEVMNDVNAAALGESLYGAGKGLEQFYCITLGTGIGGAYVYQGQVIRGHNNLLGEVGYLLKDNAGRFYEDRASVSALMKSGGKAEESSAIFLDWIEEVAKGLCEIIYVLDPGTIIIGGGISEKGRLLTDKIQTAVDCRLLEEFREKTRIVAAKAGNEACLLGVAAKLVARIKMA